MSAWLSTYYEQLATNYRILLENPSECSAVGFLQLLAALLLAAVVLRVAIHGALVTLLRLQSRQLTDRDCALAAAHESCSRAVGFRRPPRLYFLSGHCSPAFTTGLLRSDVFVSPELIGRLSGAELTAMLTHELIHVRRRDHLRVWLWELGAALLPAAVVQLFALAFVFSDAGSWAAVAAAAGGLVLLRGLLWNKVRQGGERACDDRTVDITGDPLALASALLKAWKLRVSGRPLRAPRLVASSPLVTAASPVERRVSRLLDYRRPTLRLTMGRVGEVAVAALFVTFTLFVSSLHWTGRADAEIAVACALTGEQTMVLVQE